MLARFQAVLPFFAFEIIVFLVSILLVEFGVIWLGGVVFFVLTFIRLVVEELPPAVTQVYRMVWIGGKNIERETGSAAVWSGAHPEPIEAVFGIDDFLEPNAIAHENAFAMETKALAWLGRGGKAIGRFAIC